MSDATTTTFRVSGLKYAGGTSLGGGVSLSAVNGGAAISTQHGSATITRTSHHQSSSSGYAGGALYESSHAASSIGGGAVLSGLSRSSRETSSVVSTPTIVNGGTHTHTVRTTVIESGVSKAGSVTDVRTVAISGAQMFAEATKREKEEMQRLNERLSNYIARVKQLEEQNKLLVASLGELRGKWGSKNEVHKVSFISTAGESRASKDVASRKRISKDVALSRLHSDIMEYRARIEEIARITDVERKRVPQWLAAISEADNELGKLSGRLDSLRGEERLVLGEQERLRGEWADLNAQLDAVLIDKLAYQAQVQSIRDEIRFHRTVHEEEIKELQSLLVVAPADTKEFFRSELALAIRDIRKEYQLLATAGRVKLESWYKSKVENIQELASRRGDESVVYLGQVTKMTSTMTELSTRYSQMEGRNRTLELEVSKLQKQLDEDHFSYEQAMAEYDRMLIRMREECATLVAELQSLLDSKALLDGEIAIYRAMIDGEEKRVGVVVRQIEEEHSDQWEVATKTKFNTVAHGHVAIVQSEPTGRFIVITNNSDIVEERIGGWRLKRVIVDTGREMTYYFPLGFTLKPRQKIRIFANGQGAPGPDSLVFETENSWGMGANITTSLYNAAGEEKAVYTQRTVVSNA